MREHGIDLAALRRCCSLRAITMDQRGAARATVSSSDPHVLALAAELAEMRQLLAKARALLSTALSFSLIRL